jgi:integrase
MRAQRNGRRKWIDLGPDRKQAEVNACRTANELGEGGVNGELSFNKIKPQRKSHFVATLGELIDAIELSTGVFEKAKSGTVKEYLRSLLLVVREVIGAELGRKLTRRELLDLPLSCLTGAMVRSFRILRTAGLPDDSPAMRSAKMTANTHLRNARAAVAPGVIEHLTDQGMLIPDLTPFRGSGLFKGLRVIFTLPTAEIMAGAALGIRDELPLLPSKLSYLAAVLALQAGLRRDEIVHARWTWLEPAGQPLIHVVEGPGFTPKHGRRRRIRISRWLFNELQKFKVPGSDYILAGERRLDVDIELDGLIAWLHGKGIKEEKAIHELRKWFGAFLAGYYTLTVAQRQLGHTTPLVTNDYYAGIEHFNYALAKIWEEPANLGTLPELLLQVAAANQGEVNPSTVSAFGFRRVF